MTVETRTWLNQNTLIGFTAKRGNAWHYRANEQGDEPNHYADAIPVADVHRRLFDWTAEVRPLAVANLDQAFGVDEDGRALVWEHADGYKAIVRSDTGAILGIHSKSYTPHPYGQWLLNGVSTLLGDTLQIGCAGMLRAGAVAWVSVEVPDTIETAEGVAFRPHLLACTSFDGSLATTYKRCVTLTVCDNTMAAALSEDGQEYRIRHTASSQIRLDEARRALNMVDQTADQFAAEVARLCSVTVTDRQWDAFLSELFPLDTEAGKAKTTIATNRRDEVDGLWRGDDRVSPWRGTAFGVVQAVNTWTHHVQSGIRGDRGERNAMRAITGDTARTDARTLDLLDQVLTNA